MTSARVDPKIVQMAALPFIDPALDISAWRKASETTGEQLGGVPVEVARIESFQFQARDGTSLNGRIYWPLHVVGARSVALYAHGGGWVTGSMKGSDRVTRALCNHLKGPVVTVDYRKGPEVQFPVPIDDFEDLLFWVNTHSELKDRSVFLAGDSAGAHLALTVAYRAVDRLLEPTSARTSECVVTPSTIGGVIAIYPCLDPACDSPTMREFSVDHLLSRQRMSWYWQTLLAGKMADASVTPWLRRSLSGLPPTWIVTAECDPLRAEAEVFARRLMDAGVHVSLQMQPRMLHGFLRWRALTEQADRVLQQAVRWFE
jgi:acetyl esterase